MEVNEIEIDFQKSEVGLGFNIVGGSDVPHLPIDSGIFVTKILPDGPAARDGRLQNGDKIISVNGVRLEKVTHSEAVSMFRNSGPHVKLRVQQGAERALKEKLEIIKESSNSPKVVAKETSKKDSDKDKVDKEKNAPDSKPPVLGTMTDKMPPKIPSKSPAAKPQEIKLDKPATKLSENVSPPVHNPSPKENKPTVVKQPSVTKPNVISDNVTQSNSISAGPSQRETRAETAEAKSESDPLWQHVTTLSVVIGLLGLGVAMYFIVNRARKTI